MIGSQEIGSSLVPFEMIFEALESELFKCKFHSLSSKILKFPEFNLVIKFSTWFWRTLEICMVPWHFCIFWRLMVKGRWKCNIRCKWNECHERSDSIWSKSKDFLGEIFKIKLPLRIIPAVAPQISFVLISIRIERSCWPFYENFANFWWLWVGWIPRNFKIFIWSINCHFWGKITKMITRMKFWIFTDGSCIWISL